MSYKKFTGVVAGVALLALLAYFAQGRHGSVGSNDTGGAGTSAGSGVHVADAPAGTERATVGAGRDQAMKPGQPQPVLSAPSIRDLYRSLDEGGFTPGEKAYFRLRAARFCTTLPGQDANTEPASSAADKRAISDRTLKAFTDSFCDNAMYAVEDQLLAFDELRLDDRVAEVYEFTNEAIDAEDIAVRDAAIGHLEQVMMNHDAGVESLIAAETLLQMGRVASPVQEMARESRWSLSPDELIKAQTLALQVSMCDRYGGCGQHQFLTMQQCSFGGSCRPGANALDVWRDAYAPSTVEAALEIRRKIGGG